MACNSRLSQRLSKVTQNNIRETYYITIQIDVRKRASILAVANGLHPELTTALLNSVLQYVKDYKVSLSI